MRCTSVDILGYYMTGNHTVGLVVGAGVGVPEILRHSTALVEPFGRCAKPTMFPAASMSEAIELPSLNSVGSSGCKSTMLLALPDQRNACDCPFKAGVLPEPT